MPELPEVETIVRAIRSRLVGLRILAFRSLWPRKVQPSAAAVSRGLAGRKIYSVTRRAKYIILGLDNDTILLLHLGMSGRLEWSIRGLDASREAPRFVRAVFSLSSGDQLLFCDARKFGRIRLGKNFPETFRHLGREPLARDFTTRVFQGLLRGKSRRLKDLLLDQSVVAGLGNIYTDEALFLAGLSPLRRANTLSTAETQTLRSSIRRVLRLGIRRNGASIDWIYPGGRMQEELCVYGRTGLPCPRCGRPVLYLKVGGRGTHICARCQPAPRRRRKAATF
jgi:formamidopyrimidine-DNA glycosylase